MSYKCLIVVGIKQKFRIGHMNIVIAFFYDFFDEIIYIKQLYFFEIEINKVCKLLKA